MTTASPATAVPTAKSNATTITHTLRSPHTYIHLTLVLPPSASTTSTSTDILTFRTHLTSALTTFLGLHGSAIPIDILKTCRQDIWIRVPQEDGSTVVAACGGWVGGGSVDAGEAVGWRVQGWCGWLGGLIGAGEWIFEG